MPNYVPIQDLTGKSSISDTDYVPVSDGATAYGVRASLFKSYSTDAAEAAATAAAASADAAEAAAESLESAVEEYSYFEANTQKLGNLTLTNNLDGTYTLNGSSSSFTLFECKEIPAGTFIATIEYVSGTGTDALVIRYGSISDSTAWQVGFGSTTHEFANSTGIVFQANMANYVNFKIRIKIVDVYEKYTAKDRIARETLSAVVEDYNFFDTNTQQNGNMAITKNTDGTFTLNGNTSVITFFECKQIPEGAYIASIEIISGTGTSNLVIKYGSSSDSATAWQIGVGSTYHEFSDSTGIYFQVNNGNYSNYKIRLKIVQENLLSAIDLKSRTDIEELNAKAVTFNDLIMEQLLKYNVFTCVDKSSIELNENSKLLVFGDSITASWNGWSENIVDAIGCTRTKFAVSGALFGEQVRTSDKWISTQLSQVTSAQWEAATLVIVAAGTNDAGYNTTDTELKSKVQSAISTIKENTNAPILFITPIKRSDVDEYLKLPYISGIIENVALINECSVIAGLYFPIPSGDEGVITGLMDEGIHPTAIGSKIYAMSILNAIL